MAPDFHVATGFCEEVVIFRAASSGAGFLATGAERNEILGNDFEHGGGRGFLLGGTPAQGLHA